MSDFLDICVVGHIELDDPDFIWISARFFDPFELFLVPGRDDNIGSVLVEFIRKEFTNARGCTCNPDRFAFVVGLAELSSDDPVN